MPGLHRHQRHHPGMAYPNGLTPREYEVLDLRCHGLTAVQIADRLAISPKTVDAHIEHVARKLYPDYDPAVSRNVWLLRVIADRWREIGYEEGWSDGYKAATAARELAPV